MTIEIGDSLPQVNLLRIGDNGPEEVAIETITKGRKVVLFAVPGAFTPTCHSAHVPSFIRTASAFADKGIEEIVCISVNDPFVVDNWSKSTGADAAGITMLADPQSTFTKAVGMEFSAPPVGLMDRSRRYAMLLEDGIVKILNVEAGPGECEISAGETLLAEI